MLSRIPKFLLVLITVLLAASTVSAEVLTLDDCIRLALKNYPDVIRAQNQVKVAKGTVWQAFGSFLPSLSVGASRNENRSEPGDYVINNQTYHSDGVLKQYSISGSSGITLFDGGQNIFNYLGSKADKSYYEFLAEQSRQSLILTVKTTYYAYLAALRAKTNGDEAVKRGEEQYKLANSKFEVGSASKSDVLKAQVQYGNDKLSLLDAENSIQTTRANLAYLIGVDVNSNVEFSPDFKQREFTDTEESSLKYALENQPALLASKSNLKAAKYDLRSTRGQYLPSITFSVGRSYTANTWSRVNDLKKEDAQWSLRTSINFSIFNNFQREASMARSKANLNNAKADYFYAQNNVAFQVKKAYLEITRSRQALQLAQDNESAATEDLALVQEKYNLGAATILDMLDAQVNLITAQNNKTQAEFDYNLAIANLENAMGVK
ncbi:exported hypothetical protein [Candidatus Zixiibacteriota bacterium]|nr:exported hypothetical protein [candidate division Zixibacteria bacterium]